MRIDCGTCPIQGHGCGDCVVNLFWESPTTGLGLWPAEERALKVLAEVGLIRPIWNKNQFEITWSETA
ncbi:MAG: hypothetical protein RL038_72 [Actinomycetota bacterium]